MVDQETGPHEVNYVYISGFPTVCLVH